ncbi:MAG: S49 family peptidase [Paracoccaceae bacterium]
MKNMIARLSSRPVVSVIRLRGVIVGAARLGGPALNDELLAPLIERAFTGGKPKAVALSVNSPGGSPVQSALIAARIRRLADEKKIPVYAFCEDVAASGGYWLATAADEIFADPNSIVGSIGVISASFGFHDLIGRHGVERRVYTAGEDKSLLDPFRPEKKKDIARLQRLQKIIHDNFIEQVKKRRGARLKGEGLFTGEIWSGREALDNGLVDGLAHLVPKMKEVYGDKVRFMVHGPRRSLFQRLGGSGVDAVMGAVEERLIWARYGL